MSAHLSQRYFEDIEVGECTEAVSFPLTVYRMVMAAGSTRDFNSIHHNTESAMASGADEMYANTGFLLGTWERCVRDWIGIGGTIRSLEKFRMRSFNYVGETMVVQGKVIGKVIDASGAGVISLEVESRSPRGISVGPGVVTVTLPRRVEVAA
ncbi:MULTISPECIES: acyl dehydratase [Rhodococcus]|uniref:acyl dehydratase n=1 Tax=Rhodococcus globerulus TaxID=33008 RepID=UPI001FD168B7|nr:acyl dehydratase [Rhodococcus globerulus]